MGIYSDSVDFGYKTTEAPLLDETINIHTIESTDVKSITSVVKMLVQCALYRNGPWVIKPFVRYYTDDFNKAIIDQSSSSMSETPYVTDDPAYYSELQEVGLSVDDSASGAYRLIHLMGAHSPYTMDENGNYIGEQPYNTTEEQIPIRAAQSKGALTIVAEYINQLKELGLYDDATIIVTADHGDYKWEAYPNKTTAPILLVKPSGSSEGEVVTSQAQTGHLDLPATIREALGIEQDDPTVFEISEDEDRTRYFYWNEQNSVGDLGFHEIAIEGDVLNYEDWHETGRFWNNSELADADR